MNLEDSKVSGVNEITVSDSLDAPLLKIKVKMNGTTVIPEDNELIINIDKNSSSNPSDELRQYVYDLSDTLKYYNQIGDEFILEIVPEENDIVLKALVERHISSDGENLYILNDYQTEEIESYPICMFKGTNYIYTNYSNATIEVIYPKDNDANKLFLNNAIYYNHKIKKDGEFSLDDIYFKDAFTKTEDKLNLEVNNATIDCLSSKNNNFSLDEEGNLVVNTITSNSGNLQSEQSIIDLIYPIGSIYISTNSINPSTIFGGSWEQIKDKFLLGAGDTYSVGNIGGESSHVLTTSEMPSHTHTWSQSNCTNPGNHTHVVGADKDGGAGSNRYTVHISNNNTASGQQYSPASGGAGGHTHIISGSNSNTGSGSAHNNMPPYLVVSIWRRTN